MLVAARWVRDRLCGVSKGAATLRGALLMMAAVSRATASTSADSLSGVQAPCVDFRSGEGFTIGAQHLRADGSIVSQWDAASAHLCIGTAQEIASVAAPDGSGGVLVVWTDGLNSRVRGSGHPELLRHHPAVVAAVLHRDHSRERDDATVVVVRRPEPR